MKRYKRSLSQQLVSLAVIIFSLIFIGIGILIPKALLPIYEKNVYQYLKEPLLLIEGDFGNRKIETDIAYLYITFRKNILL